ncbi:hypothetical protein BH23CHL2_BH23CHL2_28210 [soil metagenome]
MQRTNRPVWRVVATLFMLATVASLAIPIAAQDAPDDPPAVEPVVVDPTIQAVWDMTDGQIASGAVQRSWAFGPEPISAAYEYYPQSPTDFRKLVYYDKGRLDLLNPQSPDGSIWMVSGALLSTELLSGRIQLGEEEFVDREPAEIPLVGDLEQPEPVTYATLAIHSSVVQPDEHHLARANGREVDGRNLQQVGKHVTELLQPDGTIVPGAVVDHDVTIVEYEAVLGHNVASPFAGWATDLGIPALNLLGLPVTEPYWIETEIDAVPTLVLIQAFERRTLTYTPSNPAGWRVESGNVGLHYRLWRGLERPERPELARLAAEVPFGEEIFGAARDSFIDPYIFVSISLNSTGGDPFTESINGGHGLLGARADSDELEADLSDPGVNARIAADQFAQEMYAAWDWTTILTSFFLRDHQEASHEDAQAWAEAVIATSERLVAHYPPTGPRIDPIREEGKLIGEGRAAHYDPSYDAAWWAGAMASHASWGNAVDQWAVDPNGLFCVHPDYLVGERLKLEANDRVVECTIGDRVAVPHQIAWREKWAVELSWSTFTALGLDRNNQVVVSYLGDRIIEPTPTPDPSATPEETADPDGQSPSQARPDREVPPPMAGTPEATLTPDADLGATDSPSPTATATATPSPEESTESEDPTTTQ